MKNTFLQTIVIAVLSLLLVNNAFSDYYYITDDYGAGTATGDGVTDDTLAIEAAINAASNSNNNNPTVYFPNCNSEYLVTNTISIPAGISVIMDGKMKIDGDNFDICLQIGESDIQTVFCTYNISLLREIQSNWEDDTNETDIGVKFINMNTCQIQIEQVTGFTIGIQCIGSGDGFAHNIVKLGEISNNQIGLDLTNENPSSDSTDNIGWCNENLFLGGKFVVNSEYTIGQDRYGVRITSIDGTYERNNNNNFIKPSIALNVTHAEPGEAIPFLIENGINNSFQDCRLESNSETHAIIQNYSRNNEIDAGYCSEGYVKIEDNSIFKTSQAKSRQKRIYENIPSQLVYNSGQLHKLACYYDNNENIYVPGCHIESDTSDEVLIFDDGIEINSNFLELSQAIGGFVDTILAKRFIFKRDCNTDYEGRLRIRCYDENGNILSSSSSCISQGFNFSSKYGGVFTENSSWESDGANSEIYFIVDESVKKIAILVSNDSARCQIRSFCLYNLDNAITTWSPGLEAASSPITVPNLLANIAVETPNSGTWNKGRILYNASPDINEPVGWICTESGSPGTWNSFGNIY